MEANGPGPGLPGGAAIRRPQREARPAKTEFPDFGISIQDVEDQRVVIIEVPAPRQTLIFPFNLDVAEEIGKKLSAPRVVLPGG